MADLSSQNSAPGGGHVLAASLAALISVIAHGFLVFAASRVDLSFLTRVPYQQPDRQYPAMQLGSVDVSPEVQNKVLTTLRELGQFGPPDINEALDEMQVAPEVGITDPPALNDIDLPTELGGLTEPELASVSGDWQPRQDILAIESVAVGAAPVGLERRVIPAIERVPMAPDIVLPVSSEQIGAVSVGALPAPAPSVLDGLQQRVNTTRQDQFVEHTASTVQPDATHELFEEEPDEVTDVEPIERVLTARVETFAGGRGDSDYAYFRLVIERAGEQLLPVRPKDIILVQDSSASMAEQRLYFCREAMRRALAHIGTVDRFNVAKFADHTELCFPEWVTKTPETLAKAEEFINAMEAKGNTDFFASMQDLLALNQQPARPMLAFVITDGLVNKGMTDSTEIIGAFTRQNQGHISVFTMGVSSLANRYLIDLLSFCNKGSVKIIDSGRWDIPIAAEEIMKSIQRPVLSDLSVQFGTGSTVEVYPQQIGNLYLDRPLVLYGRYHRDETQLVFQALGLAGPTRCDMIFNLPLGVPKDVRSGGDATIRETWGKQKIYHLLGAYANTRGKSLLKEIRSTAREYGQVVPYRDAIGL